MKKNKNILITNMYEVRTTNTKKESSILESSTTRS